MSIVGVGVGAWRFDGTQQTCQENVNDLLGNKIYVTEQITVGGNPLQNVLQADSYLKYTSPFNLKVFSL